MSESKLKNKETDALCDAFLLLKTREDCYKFFEDLMTIKEIQSFAQRWQVARMLDEGKTYAEIEQATKASTATISRINKCLSYGADGYTSILERMKKS